MRYTLHIAMMATLSCKSYRKDSTDTATNDNEEMACPGSRSTVTLDYESPWMPQSPAEFLMDSTENLDCISWEDQPVLLTMEFAGVEGTAAYTQQPSPELIDGACEWTFSSRLELVLSGPDIQGAVEVSALWSHSSTTGVDKCRGEGTVAADLFSGTLMDEPAVESGS